MPRIRLWIFPFRLPFFGSLPFALRYFSDSEGWHPCGLLLVVVWLSPFVPAVLFVFVLFLFFWVLLLSLFWRVGWFDAVALPPAGSWEASRLAMVDGQRNVLY